MKSEHVIMGKGMARMAVGAVVLVGSVAAGVGPAAGVSGEPPVVDLSTTVDVSDLVEPGGVFTFTIEILNESPGQVEITDLTDNYPLSAECLALVGTTIEAEGSASCSYRVEHSTVGFWENQTTVTVEDDFGNTGWDSDRTVVTVSEALAQPDDVDDDDDKRSRGRKIGWLRRMARS